MSGRDCNGGGSGVIGYIKKHERRFGNFAFFHALLVLFSGKPFGLCFHTGSCYVDKYGGDYYKADNNVLYGA